MKRSEKNLKALIKKHDRLYYIEAEPIISDAAYDQIVRDYREFDPEFERFQPGMIYGAQGKPLKGKRDLPDIEPYQTERIRYNIPGFDFRYHIKIAESKWVVWYEDHYNTEPHQYVIRATSKIGWDSDIEKGEIVCV